MSIPKTKPFRYQLPVKSIKGDCPECSPRHRRTLSRYVDTQTGDPLPEFYGRCDRESNCGYHLSPYYKGTSGLSFHDEVSNRDRIGPIPKTWFRMAGNLKRKGHVMRESVVSQLIEMEGATPEQAEKVAGLIFNKPVAQSTQPKLMPVIYSIPEELFQASMGHYNHNRFARLLASHIGAEVAQVLLNRFQVGTSSRWPGACVFWYIDEQNHKRGGQIKLFDDDFHTAKYVDHAGEKRSKTSWVHSAYARKYNEQRQPYPDWLTAYLDERNAVEKSPCLFGLPQLATAPVDQPIAIVEAPKTAILCSHYFPDFIWMAVGGKSYLNADRLAPLKGRKIALFPDLNAYYDLVNEKGQANKGWLTRAKELLVEGFDITVNDYLEIRATDEDRAKGLDLADYLLNSPSFVDTNEKVQHIDTTVILKNTSPIRLPKTLEYKWQMFGRPPMWWNKIATHKALQRCLEPDDQTIQPVETIIAPDAVIKPDESEFERLFVKPYDSYTDNWDELSLYSTLPSIKPLSLFEWQHKNPSFTQLGLVSLDKHS